MTHALRGRGVWSGRSLLVFSVIMRCRAILFRRCALLRRSFSDAVSKRGWSYFSINTEPSRWHGIRSRSLWVEPQFQLICCRVELLLRPLIGRFGGGAFIQGRKLFNTWKLNPTKCVHPVFLFFTVQSVWFGTQPLITFMLFVRIKFLGFFLFQQQREGKSNEPIWNWMLTHIHTQILMHTTVHTHAHTHSILWDNNIWMENLNM